MPWGKLDDRYDDNPKVRRAWHAHPRAVGLHSMAITHCARNETDGRLDDLWLAEKLPVKRERQQVLAALLDAGLFERDGDDFIVHDYLDYNPSRAQLEAKRAKEADRKARGRANRGQVSAKSPRGHDADSAWTPRGVLSPVSVLADCPDPTRPVKDSPHTPVVSVNPGQ